MPHADCTASTVGQDNDKQIRACIITAVSGRGPVGYWADHGNKTGVYYSICLKRQDTSDGFPLSRKSEGRQTGWGPCGQRCPFLMEANEQGGRWVRGHTEPCGCWQREQVVVWIMHECVYYSAQTRKSPSCICIH